MEFNDFKHSNKWQRVFRNLETHYPDVYYEMRSWYTAGDWEVSIELKDGTRWIFDGLENLLCRLKDNEDLTQEEYTQEFARRLYRKMRDSGIGTEELSKRTGISRHTLSRYLNGHTIPNVYTLTKIVGVLQCSLNDLLDVLERR